MSILVTDFKMPVLDGVSLIRKVRNSQGPNKSIPAIFVSGFLPEFKDKVKDFEDVIFMEKPVDLESLASYMKMMIGKKL